MFFSLYSASQHYTDMHLTVKMHIIPRYYHDDIPYTLLKVRVLKKNLGLFCETRGSFDNVGFFEQDKVLQCTRQAQGEDSFNVAP